MMDAPPRCPVHDLEMVKIPNDTTSATRDQYRCPKGDTYVEILNPPNGTMMPIQLWQRPLPDSDLTTSNLSNDF